MQLLVNTSLNYHMFLPHARQRAINESVVRSLVDKFAEVGYMPSSMAIHVKQEGKCFRVYRGAHRLKACRDAQVEVKYIIDHTLTDDDVSTPADGTWTIKNHVESYRLQNPEYHFLLTFCEENEVPVDLAAALLRGHVFRSGKLRKAIKNGTWEPTNIVFANEVIILRDRFRPYYKYSTSPRFAAALGLLLKCNVFDVSRLVRKIPANVPRLLTKRSYTIPTYIEAIENVYNHGCKDKVSFKYLVTEDKPE